VALPRPEMRRSHMAIYALLIFLRAMLRRLRVIGVARWYRAQYANYHITLII